METKKLKLYSGTFEHLEGSFYIVAENIKIAKKLFFDAMRENYGPDEFIWIDMEVKLDKDWKRVDYTKIPTGVLDDQENYNYLLSIGIMDSIYEGECPRCNADETTIYYENDRGFYCNECEEISDEDVKYNLSMEGENN
jgi:hypothetical protein